MHLHKTSQSRLNSITCHVSDHDKTVIGKGETVHQKWS
jgi:hypothetical protein